jgi:uncharacterized protein YecE (DUF72 family)
VVEWRIGCSGWSYAHWRNLFYPKGLPQSRWFEFYSSVFETVELNTTFYRLPKEVAVRRWHDEAPSGFRFAAKASRYITHMKRLKDPEDSLEKFFARLEPLKSFAGPVLYQLPPQMDYDRERLAQVLHALPAGHRAAFEFRNDSWWNDEVHGLLRQRGAAFVAYNMGRSSSPAVATADFAYLRMHGPAKQYASGYTDAQLRIWIAKIEEMRGVKTAWVYFNNDGQGHAPRNACRMLELVGQR